MLNLTALIASSLIDCLVDCVTYRYFGSRFLDTLQWSSYRNCYVYFVGVRMPVYLCKCCALLVQITKKIYFQVYLNLSQKKTTSQTRCSVLCCLCVWQRQMCLSVLLSPSTASDKAAGLGLPPANQTTARKPSPPIAWLTYTHSKLNSLTVWTWHGNDPWNGPAMEMFLLLQLVGVFV